MRAPELLDKAITWLRSEFDGAVIVTELSVADWGGARIDVAAVTDSEIVGVEIKGEGDSPSRLELQGLRYGQVARKMWLLPTPDGTLAERCMRRRPKGWGVLSAVSGEVEPAIRFQIEGTDHIERWKPRDSQSLNPWAMCGTLWRDELYEIARLNGVQVRGRARVGPLTEAICEQIPVPRLHDAMIQQLRRREWRKPVIDTRRQKTHDALQKELRL